MLHPFAALQSLVRVENCTRCTLIVLMSSVLAMALGHESEDILSYEIRDIFFPMGFLRLFDGPAVNGQDLWRSMSRPRKGGGMILGAVLRPRLRRR
eukprot:s2770_g5.t1